MSISNELRKIQTKNDSMICLGLDLDPKRMPQEYASGTKGMFDFACRIIDATQDKVCAYKPNIAFYEALGPEGLSLLRLIVHRIPDEIPVIIDAKRGDIGNTAAQYADALYNKLGAHWVTLSPYMGYDSLRPFLEYKDRGVFILCLTSNPGAKDFQMLPVEGKMLYQHVAEKVAYWNKDHNCGLVVGATQPEPLKEIRQVAGEMPILIPGVGAQGGSLDQAAIYGTDNFRKLAVINVSRSVLYASRDSDFAQRAGQELTKLNEIVAALRNDGSIPSESGQDNQDQQQPQPAGSQQNDSGGGDHQSNS
jgi:orotidine-5'-phosphate decarboxylase